MPTPLQIALTGWFIALSAACTPCGSNAPVPASCDRLPQSESSSSSSSSGDSGQASSRHVACQVIAVATRTPADDVEDIQVLQDVELSAQMSTACDGEVLAEFEWNLVISPYGSQTRLTSPQGALTHFEFVGEGGTPRAGLDLTGTYIVSLRVVDNHGRVSANTAQLILNVQPPGEWWLQLDWDSSDTDLDLKLMRGPDACSHADCLDRRWGRDAGVPDPVMRLSSSLAFGPEHLLFAEPADGTYSVWVSSRAGSLPTRARLRFFNEAALLGEYRRDLDACSSWEVIRLVRRGLDTSIVEVDRVGGDSGCH